MPELQQLLAVSALLTHCEGLVASGVLPQAREADLRILIVRVSRAFGMPTVAEREPTTPANANYTIAAQLDAIRAAMIDGAR